MSAHVASLAAVGARHGPVRLNCLAKGVVEALGGCWALYFNTSILLWVPSKHFGTRSSSHLVMLQGKRCAWIGGSSEGCSSSFHVEDLFGLPASTSAGWALQQVDPAAVDAKHSLWSAAQLVECLVECHPAVVCTQKLHLSICCLPAPTPSCCQETLSPAPTHLHSSGKQKHLVPFITTLCKCGMFVPGFALHVCLLSCMLSTAREACFELEVRQSCTTAARYVSCTVAGGQ